MTPSDVMKSMLADFDYAQSAYSAQSANFAQSANPIMCRALSAAEEHHLSNSHDAFQSGEEARHR